MSKNICDDGKRARMHRLVYKENELNLIFPLGSSHCESYSQKVDVTQEEKSQDSIYEMCDVG